METDTNGQRSFDEVQSIQVIREMIQVSHKKIRHDGILFIVWGWIGFFTYMSEFLISTNIHTLPMKQFVKYAGIILAIGGFVFTAFYLYRQRKRVTTYIGISLRYVWISLVVCMVLINLIQFNVTHRIFFELQHPIFMVLIAFATVVTGGILRYRLIIIGGIVFGLLAYISSHLPLQQQLLAEAIGWLIAFIIPGHVLYSKRKS